MDGLQALDLIKNNRYDAVFMDIRMPGLDGLKTTARIRKELNCSMDDLPVIGISATLSMEEKEQGMISGMNTFLPKPFAERMLLDVFLSLKAHETEKSIPQEIVDTEQPKTHHVKVNFSNLYHLANQDSTFVRQMLTGFLSGTEKGLGEIADGVQSRDFNMIMEAAHRISAPCKHLEASGLYAILKAIEEQAKNDKNIAKLARLSADLKKNFAEIERIVQEHMAKMTE
jgi:CheY-like chemotaxis protein